MTRPPDHNDIVDDEITGVINDALNALVLLQNGRHDTNAAAEIDAVTTLIRHARSRLPGLVADARDQANSWTDIADQLGVTPAHAIARYGLPTRRRRHIPELD